MAIIRWRDTAGLPGPQFAALRNEMDRLFESFLGKPGAREIFSSYPPVNLYEDDNNLYLTAELPGMAADQLDINAEETNLQIKGERKIEAAPEKGYYHRRERESGTFTKKIELPYPIDSAKVSAQMADGVLTVTLPKREEVKPRKIEVKIN